MNDLFITSIGIIYSGRTSHRFFPLYPYHLKMRVSGLQRNHWSRRIYY